MLPADFFDDPPSSILKVGGQMIKDSRLRWAALFTLPEGKGVFIKRDKTKNWMDALKLLFLPSKGRKEWLMASRLEKSFLPVPKPLGWMERRGRGLVRESYYFAEAIGSGLSLLDFLEAHAGETVRLADQGEGRWMESLAHTIKGFHDLGLFHRDLHAGNFLSNGDSFFLTDLHRARIVRYLSLNQRLWSLSHFFHSLGETGRSEEGKAGFLRFMAAYFAGDPSYIENREKYTRKVLSSMERLRKRWWRSRTKRCMKESTEFSVWREKGIKIYHRKDFGVDHIEKIIKGHEDLLKERPPELLKHAPESTVSIVDAGEGKICVKQFYCLRLTDRLKETFRISKGRKAWVSGNGLTVRGIPSLRMMACVERRKGFLKRDSFLLMEAAPKGAEMDRYLIKGFQDFQERRLFIKSFAEWLGSLHRKNLYHKDMKTCNIIVAKKPGPMWQFRLLDLEDVCLDRQVCEKDLFYNFLQLNTSIPKAISSTDRLRLYRTYKRMRPIFREEKRFFLRLLEKSRGREIVYVSPGGVVEDKWN